MPNDYVKSVFQIDIEKLAEAGFKGIITDLDNTLVGWDVKSPTIEIQQWFKRANELGITITIVSNNNEDRVSSFSKDQMWILFSKQENLWAKAFKKLLNI